MPETSDRIMRDQLAELIETLDKAWCLAMSLDMEQHADALYELTKKANEKALHRLAFRGGLIGAEFCNECAEVNGTVTGVDYESDITPMIHHTGGDEYLTDIGPERFFRVPGSTAYGELATAELLRRREVPAEPEAA